MASQVVTFKLAVQKYLETKSLDQLEAELGVSARLSTNGRKMSLNYDQIRSIPGEIVDQCRGIILRPQDKRLLTDDPNWKSVPLGPTKVIAYPFDRFYNLGDPKAPCKVNFKARGLKVEDKVDGTLCIVYWDNFMKQWCVATRSVPDADLPISSGAVTQGDLTFRGLFERGVQSSLGISFDEFTDLLDVNFTWMFELTSPINKVVVKHDKDGIILLGCRSIVSGKEKDDPFAHIRLSVPSLRDVLVRPARFPIDNVEDITNFVMSRSGGDHEGVVIVDYEWNRVKIKNPDYVLRSKTREILLSSRRNMIEYILAEKIDDILPMLDADVAEACEKARLGLVKLFDDMDAQYKVWRGAVSTRKEFAGLVALSHYDNKPFFELWEKKFESTRDHYVRLAKSGRISPRALDHLDSMIAGK